ncbi:MAG: hypothetical protein Phog2KO_10730 [Phototrophicaceae bacterium]
MFSAPYFFDPTNPQKTEKESIPLPEKFTKVTNFNYLQINLPYSVGEGINIKPLFAEVVPSPIELVFLLGFIVCMLSSTFIYIQYIEPLQLENFETIMTGFCLCLIMPFLLIANPISSRFETPKKEKNQTYGSGIEINKSHLNAGNLSIPLDSIQQIYTRAISMNGELYYSVFVIHADGEEESKLVGMLKRHNEALYIEQEIESYLGLRDQAVDGEFR